MPQPHCLQGLYTRINLDIVPTSALTQTTSSAVIQLLRQSLDRGRWSPGEPLRQEEIAAEFGVSRVPVREAFFQLQAEGLVQVVPNKGVYVTTLTAANLREHFRLRRLLESDVLADAVPLHTAASLHRLETVQGTLDKARTVADWMAGDREFHEALYAPADRPETLALIRRVRFIVDRFYFARLKPSTRAQGWYEEHHALIRAARRRDPAAAVRLLVKHLDETERSALAALPAA
jgi:DNA-binding GntR family transcriptional regulator